MAREKWTMERLEASMERAKRGELSHPHKDLMARVERATSEDPKLKAEVTEYAEANPHTLAGAYMRHTDK